PLAGKRRLVLLPLLVDGGREDGAMTDAERRLEEVAALLRERIRRVLPTGRAGYRGVDHELPGGLRAYHQRVTLAASRFSAASRYRLWASRTTSAKSSGQSPNAPASSRSALRTSVVPSVARENQCRATRSGGSSPSATSDCTPRRRRELWVST